MVGGSSDPRGQKIARAFAAIMQRAGLRFGILGRAETSTGECVRRASNEMPFQQLANDLVVKLNGLGVIRIVTCDLHACNSLKNEYPEFGGWWEVVHHTQLIAQLIAEGKLRIEPGFEHVPSQEPRYLGRHNGEFEAPRAVLQPLATDRPLEFALNCEKAMCCGAGGARMWLEESIGKRINVLRVEQALPLAPRMIVTGCPYRAVMVADGIAALGKQETIETRDLAELVVMAMVRS